ncbi:hypothetical protein ERW51_18620 [Aliivibrio finisterrensis]|uniref:hypothetical protein n=1 Tax=Aliivibrio finisterrensis TaxID=511998 RepID=UPI00101EA686|nr:hypothetical protein [Aliivibrio finisterrensis]RYU63336.1 hypothetical protein ERW54_19085 [Aliivibrio finisterrensis]RYU65184.1 hypothetical protein ERW51_18620 [Aliivibrio finisterrensis]RYU68893.1 hypothetical protein ERW48_19185 [Aliivibrio finisterrensis]
MYNNKPNQFFSISQSVDDSLGNTLSFVFANYSAFRNMWYQVRSLETDQPDHYLVEAHNLFYADFSSPGGVDFNKLCIDTEWHQHEQQYAKWIVQEACTLYEGWAEDVCELALPSGCNPRNYIKALQFPNGVNSKGQPQGYQITVNKVNDTKSGFLKDQFLPILKTSRMNKWSDIDSYLLVYRYFKECRNGFIHSGGLVTSDIQSLYQDVIALQTTNSPFCRDFNLVPPVVGESIALNLRDCIQFASLVRHLIATFDAALSVGQRAEAEVLNKVRNELKRSPKWNLPKDSVKRTKKIHRLLVAARVPEPTDINVLANWLKNEGVLNWNN